jgi:uracil-DNA glycosylase
MRRMSDPDYVTECRNHLHGEHIAPITQLCESLQAPDKGPVPYVDPGYDVDGARILILTPAPGAGTVPGFLSHENDDDASERLVRVLAAAGLDPKHTIPWTVHPWTQDDYAMNLTKDRITAGVKPFNRFLKRVPRVVAIMAHGGEAQKLVKAFSATIGGTVLADKAIKVFPLPALHAQGANKKLAPEDLEEQMVDTYGQAMRLCGIRPLVSEG